MIYCTCMVCKCTLCWNVQKKIETHKMCSDRERQWNLLLKRHNRLSGSNWLPRKNAPLLLKWTFPNHPDHLGLCNIRGKCGQYFQSASIRSEVVGWKQTPWAPCLEGLGSEQNCKLQTSHNSNQWVGSHLATSMFICSLWVLVSKYWL